MDFYRIEHHTIMSGLVVRYRAPPDLMEISAIARLAVFFDEYVDNPDTPDTYPQSLPPASSEREQP